MHVVNGGSGCLVESWPSIVQIHLLGIASTETALRMYGFTLVFPAKSKWQQQTRPSYVSGYVVSQILSFSKVRTNDVQKGLEINVMEGEMHVGRAFIRTTKEVRKRRLSLERGWK